MTGCTLRAFGRSWLVGAPLWLFLALFFSTQASLRFSSEPLACALPTRGHFLAYLALYGVWSILAPIVAIWVRRYPVAAPFRPSNLALHAVSAPVAAAAHLVASEPLLQLVRWAQEGAAPWRESLIVSFRVNFLESFLIYVGIVGATEAVRGFARARERELLLARAAEQLARARLAALQGQMQPHFLFNTLNSISALAFRDPAAADRMIGGLSQLLRRTMNSADAPEVPLRSELETMELYLGIERTRFGDRLHTRVAIGESDLDVLVPNLALQTLAENSVRHAVSNSAKPVTIDVIARRVDGVLELIVRDDGPGFTTAPVEGTGIRNLRERLATLHSEKTEVVLTNAGLGGAETRLRVPVRRAREAET